MSRAKWKASPRVRTDSERPSNPRRLRTDLILPSNPRHIRGDGCPANLHKETCTCAMNNIHHFIEPVVLYLLADKGPTHGYELRLQLREHALTDREPEKGALYRTLHVLEHFGNVRAEWSLPLRGPARRVYTITRAGRHHLHDWTRLLRNFGNSMVAFADRVEGQSKHQAAPPAFRPAARRKTQ